MTDVQQPTAPVSPQPISLQPVPDAQNLLAPTESGSCCGGSSCGV